MAQTTQQFMNSYYTSNINRAAPVRNLTTTELQANDVLLKKTTLLGDTFFSQATQTSAHLRTSQAIAPLVTYIAGDPLAPTLFGTPLTSENSTDVAGTISLEKTTGELQFNDGLRLAYSKQYNGTPVVLTELLGKDPGGAIPIFGTPVVASRPSGFDITGWYLPAGGPAPGTPLPAAKDLKFNYFVIGVSVYPPPQPDRGEYPHHEVPAS